LVAWKCDSWRVVRLSAQGYMAPCENIFAFWSPENAVLQGSWDPRTHSYLSYTEPLFGIMVAWNCDSSRVLRHSAQGHVATGRRLFKILVDWKCISSGFMSPLAQGYISSC
jgi:hypothetical protein